MGYTSFNLMGTKLNILTEEDLFSIIGFAISHNFKYIIGNHNLHSLYIYHHNAKMKYFYDNCCKYTYIDGMPIILLGKILGLPLKRKNRFTSIDFINPMFKLSEKAHFRIFLLGSKPTVNKQALEHFSSSFPKLMIETHHGFFNMENPLENQKIIDKINDFSPNILLVGMGMPRQEIWILENAKKLNINIILNLGAFMDYFSKELPTPPRWLGQLGLEWAFRLLCEPKRLWKRYLLEPWFILKIFIREVVSKIICYEHLIRR